MNLHEKPSTARTSLDYGPPLLSTHQLQCNCGHRRDQRMLEIPVIARVVLQRGGRCSLSRGPSAWTTCVPGSAGVCARPRRAATAAAMKRARDLVPEIHKHPLQAVVYATGGGMQASVCARTLAGRVVSEQPAAN